MHYFDPKRPKVSFKPAYCAPSGAPIAPLPQLSVWPHAEGDQVTIGMWLLTSSNAASLHSTDLALGQFPVFIDEWRADPEAVLRSIFGYSYEPNPKVALLRPPIQPQLSLEDLGL